MKLKIFSFCTISAILLLTSAVVFSNETEKTEYVEKEKSRKNKGVLGFGESVPAEELGIGSLFLRNTIGTKVINQEMQVLYFPTQDEIVIKFRSMGLNNFACFDNETRYKIIQAFSTFDKDFEKQLLNDKNKKSYKAYGSLQGKYRWGVMNGASVAKPRMHIGYRFLKEKPYFCITYEDCLAEHPGQSDKNAERFGGNWLLFNRSQVLQIASEFFNEQKIKEIMTEYVPVIEDDTTNPLNDYKGYKPE